MQCLGIDIGGSGIKGAPVESDTGELLADRLRIDTPEPSTPAAVAAVVGQIVEHFSWTGKAGMTFPGVVKSGVVHTAANFHKDWVGTDAVALMREATGLTFAALNDAGAAGIAEVKFGAAKGHSGVVLMVTLGTGIGTSLFLDGVLVPNTELGHIELDGKDAEETAAARVRDEQGLSWEKYAKRVNRYLTALYKLMWPDLFVIGGGVSRKAEKWLHLLDVPAEVVAATLTNEAGIVGAALAAVEGRLAT